MLECYHVVCMFTYMAPNHRLVFRSIPPPVSSLSLKNDERIIYQADIIAFEKLIDSFKCVLSLKYSIRKGYKMAIHSICNLITQLLKCAMCTLHILAPIVCAA